MSKGKFFISWELWQEMTFVLAMGIVAVFFVGLIKLWVSNRHMRQLEELDAEKQMRMTHMKKSGLGTAASSSNRLVSKEIPFGVKALENNIEVEGIWVARMASMASRPPERKWSSMRKVRSPSTASSLGNARGSRRANSKISRSEIVVPSSQTRNKLEDLSLLKKERSRDPVPEPVGTLGKIQRGLKKMTSTETGHAGERKKDRSNQTQAFGAKEFREGAQARTPQRFYPPPTANNDTSAAMPLMDTQESKRPGRLVKKQSATRRQQHGRSSSRESKQSSAQGRASLTSTASSEGSRSRERQRAGRPSIPSRKSSESATTSASRSSHRQPRRQSRESQHEGRGWRGQQQQDPTANMHRYPPNSSRSGGAYPSHSRPAN